MGFAAQASILNLFFKLFSGFSVALSVSNFRERNRRHKLTEMTISSEITVAEPMIITLLELKKVRNVNIHLLLY